MHPYSSSLFLVRDSLLLAFGLRSGLGGKNSRDSCSITATSSSVSWSTDTLISQCSRHTQTWSPSLPWFWGPTTVTGAISETPLLKVFPHPRHLASGSFPSLPLSGLCLVMYFSLEVVASKQTPLTFTTLQPSFLSV